MSAPHYSITFSQDALLKLIAEELGVETSIDLGETGRTFTRGSHGVFNERAEFDLFDLLEYDRELDLDEDALKAVAEDAMRIYVRQSKDGWRAAVLHHAEAFKQEMLTHPAGE